MALKLLTVPGVNPGGVDKLYGEDWNHLIEVLIGSATETITLNELVLGDDLDADGNDIVNVAQIRGQTSGTVYLDFIHKSTAGAFRFFTQNGAGADTERLLFASGYAQGSAGLFLAEPIIFNTAMGAGASNTQIWSDAGGGNLLFNAPSSKEIRLQNALTTMAIANANGFLGKAYSAASDPGTPVCQAGFFILAKNTSGGAVKLWYNDGGVMKSVTLT